MNYVFIPVFVCVAFGLGYAFFFGRDRKGTPDPGEAEWRARKKQKAEKRRLQQEIRERVADERARDLAREYRLAQKRKQLEELELDEKLSRLRNQIGNQKPPQPPQEGQ